VLPENNALIFSIDVMTGSSFLRPGFKEFCFDFITGSAAACRPFLRPFYFS
jgi:hypothetical protein